MEISLLPVVTRMLPSVPLRYSTAASMLSTVMMSSPAAKDSGRRRRMYSAPVSAQASLMWPVMRTA